MKRWFFVFCLMLCYISLSAQKFIIDPLFADSVECVKAVSKEGKWIYPENSQKVMVPRGFEIDSCGPAQGYYIAFKHAGEVLLVYKGELKFSPNNPEGVPNPFNKRHNSIHSPLGYWYATYTPAIIISLVLGLTLLLFLVAYKSKKFVKATLVTIPAALLVVTAIEVVGFLYLGNLVFWWCDNDRYGFFGSFFRLFPFAAVVSMQYFSFIMFKKLLLCNSTSGEEKELSVKPAAISLAVCIPLFVAYYMIVQVMLHHEGPLVDLGGIVLFVGSLAIGILITLKRNITALGFFSGTTFTVFCIIYLIGLLVALWGILVVLMQLIIQVLMVIGAVILFFVLGKRTFYKDTSGRVYEGTLFTGPNRRVK